MKAKDIKPGTVYAYRDPLGTVRPIVFLTPAEREHLYIKSSTSGVTFRKAPEGSRPRGGTVWNAGTIGYPAVLGSPGSDLDDLTAVTLARFRSVTSTLGRRCEYTLVFRMARVIGPWEEFAASPDSSSEED
ncbi:hypothetical protein [Nonomuraea bangladeshensis]|uniref:hypothetical protein n=1 Tax=Nonomuraea bangladeshensis TaxID=404385 RepID=UPI003C2D892E